VILFTDIKYSSKPIIKYISFRAPNVQSFSPSDLDRLKNEEKWLSDSHITFALQYVPFFFSVISRKLEMFQTFFSTKYSAGSEDPAFGHNILVKAISGSRKIWRTI
jgi:hypothetical protein